MIQYVSEFSVTDNLRESLGGGDGAFPFAAKELNVIEYVNNCAKWHWHGFVEFTHVMEGEVECCTPRGMLTARAGEGYFINASVLHMVRMAAGASDAKYRVLQFETDMLTSAGSILGRYVAPVLRCQGIEAVGLRRDIPGQRALLEDMEAQFSTAQREPPCYELAVLGQLAGLWAHLYALVEPRLAAGEAAATDTVASRVKAMLAFIHANYADAITVQDIADAASVSRREAFRAFRQVLGTTPTLYVLQHRVQCAARLLLESDLSVTEIGSKCGFAGASYFSKAFHDLTGVSPRDFRSRSGRYEVGSGRQP